MPIRSILKPKQVTKSEVIEAPVDITPPSKSRIAFIELNDGRRIGLGRSYEANKNLLTSSEFCFYEFSEFLLVSSEQI